MLRYEFNRPMPFHLFDSDPSPQLFADSQPFLSTLTRRSFLAALIAAGCSSGGSRPRIPTSRRAEESWALISDTHICSDPLTTNRGGCMAANLQRVVRQVVDVAPDHALINGDLAFAQGHSSDYTTFSRTISPILCAGVPVHLTLGNHDDRQNFLTSVDVTRDRALENKFVSDFETGPVRWLMLDSLDKVNEVRGSLGTAQRDWLANRLDAEPRMPTIICMHHNPDPFVVGLRDTAQLMDIIVPRRQVKAVVYGHTHVYNVWQQEGLHFINLPAVAYRLNPSAALGWVLATMKGDGMLLQFRNLEVNAPSIEDEMLHWRTDA